MKRKLIEQLPVQVYTLEKNEKTAVKRCIKKARGDFAFMNVYAEHLDVIPHVIADIYIVSVEEDERALEKNRMPGFRWACDGKTVGTVKLNRKREWTDTYLQTLISNSNSLWRGRLGNYILFHRCTEEAEGYLDEWYAEWKNRYYFYGEKQNSATWLIDALSEAIKSEKNERKNEQKEILREKRKEELEDLNKISSWVNQRLPQYLIYKQKGKYGHAFCTSCGKNWNYQKEAEWLEDEWYKMNEKCQCPRCGAEVTAKPSGRYQNIKESVNVIYIQHTETGIAVRFEEAYRKSIWNPIMDNGENQFQFCTVKVYYLHEREKLNNKRRNLMQKLRNDMIRINKNGLWIYTDNLKQATEGTVWGYMDLSQFQKKSEWGETIAFAMNLLRYPGYEALYKCGFWELIHTAALTNSNGVLHPQCRKLHEVLGISRQQLIRIREMNIKAENINMNLLRILQHEKEYGQLTEEQLKYLWKRTNEITVLNILPYTGRYTRTINYLKKGNNETIWLDYLQMAEKAGRNMEDEIVLYPKKLKEMHDHLVEEENREKYMAERSKVDTECAHIEEIEEKVNKIFGFESEDMIIRAPHIAHEIMEEGKMLHHCVYANGYHKKMNKEKTFILFLRKKKCEEMPFYTLEVSPSGKLNQCYGEYNRKPEWDTVEPFIEQYKKQISKRTWKGSRA